MTPFRSAPVGREACLLQCVAHHQSPSPLGPWGLTLQAAVPKFLSLLAFAGILRPQEARRRQQGGRAQPGGYFFPSLQLLGHPWQWSPSPVAPFLPSGRWLAHK